jgi:16S rRNA (cytosine1402-N4)-methyltransferase
MKEGATGYHTPVLLQEVLESLVVRKPGKYLDGTVGGGGHFRAIADHLNQRSTLIGIDRDPDAIENIVGYQPSEGIQIIVEQCRFSQFDAILHKYEIEVLDGVFLDLGVSSYQIDTPERGFSYMKHSLLDMRMNPDDTVTASTLIADSSEEHLADILERYGEVGNPLRMARTLKKCIASQPIRTSTDLKKCLEREYGPQLKIKIFAKVFQALRIAVNRELEELEVFLSKIFSYLSPGGRLAIIAYHSLEDRLVKRFIQENERQCVCPPELPMCRCGRKPLLKRINRRAIKSSESEIKVNPRARSARLRITQKL